MIARLKRLNGGRARIWWLHHGREAIRAAQLVAIVALYLAVSTFDYHDQLAQAEADRANVAETLRQERAVNGMPRTAWIIEAKTPQEAQLRLAEIAGDLDTWRARNRGAQ